MRQKQSPGCPLWQIFWIFGYIVFSSKVRQPVVAHIYNTHRVTKLTFIIKEERILFILLKVKRLQNPGHEKARQDTRKYLIDYSFNQQNSHNFIISRILEIILFFFCHSILHTAVTQYQDIALLDTKPFGKVDISVYFFLFFTYMFLSFWLPLQK